TLAEGGSWFRREGRYIPIPLTKEDRNAHEQAIPRDGAHARRGDRRRPESFRLRHLRRRVRGDQLAPRPTRHAGAGRGPERRIRQPVRAAGQPAAGPAGEPRPEPRNGAASRAARLIALARSATNGLKRKPVALAGHRSSPPRTFSFR